MKSKDYIDLLIRERDFRWWKEDRKRFDERSEPELRFFAVYGCFPQALQEPPKSEYFIAGSYRVTIRVEELRGGANSGETVTWPPQPSYSDKSVIDRCKAKIEAQVRPNITGSQFPRGK